MLDISLDELNFLFEKHRAQRIEQLLDTEGDESALEIVKQLRGARLLWTELAAFMRERHETIAEKSPAKILTSLGSTTA